MPMTVEGMAEAIVAAVGPATDQAKLEAFAEQLATAIVTYIQDEAQVTVVGVQGGGGTASGTIS
jgi:hypothetical protein